MNELANNVRSELLALQTMNEKELRKKWESLYGREAPNCGAPFLRRRLAYRVQEIAYGGVAKETLKKIRSVNVAKIRKPTPKVNLRVGTSISRIWHHQKYEVTILQNGFEWNGQVYPSLSTIATKICGVNRNGFEFFGIQKG